MWLFRASLLAPHVFVLPPFLQLLSVTLQLLATFLCRLVHIVVTTSRS
jgi:hypothetical protein